MHALCLPLGASISLLVMFFFFDSMQMLFAVCTASKFILFLLMFKCKNIIEGLHLCYIILILLSLFVCGRHFSYG